MTPEQELDFINWTREYISSARYHVFQLETEFEREIFQGFYARLNDQLLSIDVHLNERRKEIIQKKINRINNFMPEGHLNNESD